MSISLILGLLLLPASPLLSPQIAEAAALPDLPTYASTTAQQLGLDPQLFHDVIECESTFDPNAVGDNGTSWGIAQLHNPETAWGISTTTAMDPYASIQIMAKAWAAGKGNKWTCYRKLYEKPGT